MTQVITSPSRLTPLALARLVVVNEVGIVAYRPSNAHAFRHAAAIRWLDEGVDLPTVSAWLGHHSPEFTASVYAVRSEWQLREKFFESHKEE